MKITAMAIDAGNFEERLAGTAELTFRQVSKYFTVFVNGRSCRTRRVLNEISFTFPAGRIVGLIGRTGVGKTTFGRVLGGLLRPDAGAVYFGDIDLFDCSPRNVRAMRRHLRYVPQNPDAVIPDSMTVTQALCDARKASRLTPQESRKWQDRIEKTSLYDPAWANRSVGDLSLGQRRRIVNLRSLQSCPRFLILDEPFNGLDSITKQDMLLLLCSIAREKRIGVLFISHDVEALSEVCAEIWQLERGKLTAFSK